MKKLLSMFLACVLLLGILPTSAWAADSVEAALGEVDIYNGGYELGYLSINGAVKKQDYTYFMYKSNDGTTKEVPAYCVNPYLKGVPQKVEPGESIKYLAEERSSDPKVVGIISNGYPHRSLGELNLDNKYQAYYATKMALWCYLLSTWDINNLKVAPGLSGSELDIGNRILAAAKDIYKRGTTYNYMLTPKMTATPDHSVAYPVSVEGKDYYPKLPRDMGADCRSLRGSCSMTGMINRADAALLNMRLQNTDTGIIFLTRLAPLCMTLRYITWSTIRSTLEHIRHRRAPLMDIRRAIRR